MYPPRREKVDYEKVKTNDFIIGEIVEIMHEKEHKFTFQGETKTREAVRFKFKLENYKYSHYSKWHTFSYGSKSVLYNKYLSNLVENATPDMNFNLSTLRGMQVKTMWKGDDYQDIELIRPLNNKAILQGPFPPNSINEEMGADEGDVEL